VLAMNPGIGALRYPKNSLVLHKSGKNVGCLVTRPFWVLDNFKLTADANYGANENSVRSTWL